MIIVAGIGGSNLGAMAVWQALGDGEGMVFAETLDARKLKRILALLKKKNRKKAALLIISKSGTTAETIANASVILRNLSKNDKVFAVTDEGSKLWRLAKEKKWEISVTPAEVAGRFSVFTPVGTLPLKLAGIKTSKFLAGSERAKKDKNAAEKSAEEIFQNYKAGKTIHDIFIFEPDLEYLGKWYRQLIGESLGKDGKGMTPTVSIGTTDLHSVGQLYLGGPKDKFTTFISVKNHDADFIVPDMAGKKFSEILAATLAGVKSAYKKQGLPFMEIELPDISEESLGYFMQMKMMETVHLGKLMGVNPFDQPQVELYKEETRKLLRQL